MIWALWMSVALAAEPVSCDAVSLSTPDQSLSVAWVSPVGQTVKRNARLQVVPTADLRSFLTTEGDGSVARMLQVLGLRKRSSDPHKRYKITVFDVSSADLCRPLDSEDGAAITGVRTCDRDASGSQSNGCGTTVDHATRDPGLMLYQGAWADLARNGFCVLPAERFVGAASQR